MRQAKLIAWTDVGFSNAQLLLPLLYEPTLVNLADDKILLRGFQKDPREKGPTYLQEWLITYIGISPPTR